MTKLEISVPMSPQARRRLTDVPDCTPWVRADESKLSDIALFWLPASSFPLRAQEKTWLTEFLSRLTASLKTSHGLRAEIFLEYKCLDEASAEAMRGYSQQCVPMLGIGRSGEDKVSSMPKSEAIKESIDSGKRFDPREWIANYLYWFPKKQPERQRELFMGLGGMTTIFLAPDPKTIPPRIPMTPALRASFPAFQKIDLEAALAGTYAKLDGFLERSKELFGADLKDTTDFPGYMFILPLLGSAQFFSAAEELRKDWFSLFDVYINESKKDNGILLAFQKPEYEIVLLDVLESMNRDGLQYLGSRRT